MLWGSKVDRIPKEIHILILMNMLPYVENVLRNLKWGNLPGWAYLITWVLKTRELFPAVFRERGDHRSIRELQHCWLGRQEMTLSQEVQALSRSWRGQRKFPPVISWKEYSPPRPWIHPSETCGRTLAVAIGANTDNWLPLPPRPVLPRHLLVFHVFLPRIKLVYVWNKP